LVGMDSEEPLHLVWHTMVYSSHDHDVGNLNDLWMYNISSMQWTWLSGSNALNVNGTYGTRGVPSANNFPGGRFRVSMVFDSNLKVMYVFGGEGYTESSSLGK
jgi:hypothetical protein